MNVNPKLGQLMVYKTLLSKHIICLTFLINYIPGFAEMEQSTKDVRYILINEKNQYFQTIVSKSWFAAKILRGVTESDPVKSYNLIIFLNISESHKRSLILKTSRTQK